VTPAVFGRDADCGDVSGVIGFEQAYDKADHGAALRNYPVSQRFGSSQQIFESVSTVGFAIYKAALIQTPAFIELRHT
jgi:hypothetical protein